MQPTMNPPQLYIDQAQNWSNLQRAQRLAQQAMTMREQAYTPAAGGNPIAAVLSGLGQFLGARRMEQRADDSMENAIREYFAIQNRKEDSERERKAAEDKAKYEADIAKAIAVARGTKQAERDFAVPKFDASIGAWTDPTNRTITPDQSAQDFLMRKAQAGRSVTSVNMPAQVNENAFQKRMGEQDADAFVQWRDQAIAGRNLLQQANAIEQILGQQQTGRTQEAMALAGQYFGTEAGANLQALRGAIQPVVLAQVKQLGTGSGISDADRRFIEAGMPGFGNDPRANAKVLDIMRKSAQRSIGQFEKAQAYVGEHNTLSGFMPDFTVPTGQASGMPQAPRAPRPPAQLSNDELLQALGVKP